MCVLKYLVCTLSRLAQQGVFKRQIKSQLELFFYLWISIREFKMFPLCSLSPPCAYLLRDK